MCGIAGQITVEGAQETRLRRSAQQMRHRGPDACGIEVREKAGFAFQRLAIIDLSPDGNQPMTNEDETVWLVFNGEIYNHRELRKQLEGCHRFHSQTDSEVLVHGYEEWGFQGLLQRIDGMFAFAIWDERTRELLLARDRVGKKPLYYSRFPEGFAFASTLNTLLELLPEKPEIDVAALDHYLVYQAVPAPMTIYSGVFMLPPAHCARWREGGVPEIERYWNLSYAHKIKRSEEDLLAELDTLLREAVSRRLMSDVPLGAFLSGGVDSSLIVAIMSDLGAGPVEAINIGFEDAAYDERQYAREVATKWGARLHEHVMKPAEIQNLPEIVWHYGQPLADVSIVPTYAVARLAREHVTVVLNGDGGDEAFAGYARPIVMRAAEQYRALVPNGLQGAGAQMLRLAGKRGKMLAHSVSNNARDSFTYDRGLRGIRSELYAPPLLARLVDTDPDRHYADIWAQADGPTDMDRALYGEFTTYLPDQLLVKMDVSTMAHSVEARSPLLDRKVLEFAATIPAAQLTAGYKTKSILKRLAERYVPGCIVYRRKRGFVMPASHWLRCDLGPHLRHLLSPDFLPPEWFRPEVVARMVEEHLRGIQDWGDPLWTLLVLSIWRRIFVDRTLSRCDPLESSH